MMLTAIFRPGRSLRNSIQATAVPSGKLRAKVSSVRSKRIDYQWKNTWHAASGIDGLR